LKFWGVTPGEGVNFGLSFFSGSLLFGFQGCKVRGSRVLVSIPKAKCHKLFHEDYETKRGGGFKVTPEHRSGMIGFEED
jgi:hypothetical protein